jgi:hypothetical protein
MFDVVKLANPTDMDFVHEFAGKKFKIKANSTVDLPLTIARDTAYYLAQRVCMSRGLPFFGQEHEDVINELLGNKQNGIEAIEDEFEDISNLTYETPKVEDKIQELVSTPMDFTPAETPKVEDKIQDTAVKTKK